MSLTKGTNQTAASAAGLKTDYNKVMEKGGNLMCTLFEELVREGEIKGEARGEARGEAKGRAKGARGIILMGKKCNLSDKEISAFLRESLNITLKEAQEYLDNFYENR